MDFSEEDNNDEQDQEKARRTTKKRVRNVENRVTPVSQYAGAVTCFTKKSRKNQPIENWQELSPGDKIKSVKGYGPYWLNPKNKRKDVYGILWKVFCARNRKRLHSSM